MPNTKITSKNLNEMPAVDPAEMAFAMGQGGAAAMLAGPAPNPENYSVNISLSEKDPLQTVSFTDIPLNRFMLSVKQFCGEDSEKFMSLIWRIWALDEVIDSSEMKRWVSEDDNRPGWIEVHDAVVHVAATIPLNKRGTFNKRTFFKQVAEAASRCNS